MKLILSRWVVTMFNPSIHSRFEKFVSLTYGVFMAEIVYAGSFDPLTFGHLDIITRLAKTYDELHIVLADNPDKKYAFTKQERLLMMQLVLAKVGIIRPFVWVLPENKILVSFMEDNKISLTARGIRDYTDFNYENKLAIINRGLGKDIETVLMFTSPELSHVSSSSAKTIAALGGDISGFVPEIIREAVIDRMKGKL